uniref:JNK1/MAPK8 associated membrane protein n=1 Tax=Oryctolagus cuniculus TaxID=9986 RepID=A0A5F9DKS4_RABIT
MGEGAPRVGGAPVFAAASWLRGRSGRAGRGACSPLAALPARTLAGVGVVAAPGALAAHGRPGLWLSGRKCALGRCVSSEDGGSANGPERPPPPLAAELTGFGRGRSLLQSGRRKASLGAVDIQPACLGLYCRKTLLFKNGSTEIYGECGVCPRGQRTDAQKLCQPCTESPELYDWLYLGFMAMLPLVLHWFFIEWYSGKKRSARSVKCPQDWC